VAARDHLLAGQGVVELRHVRMRATWLPRNRSLSGLSRDSIS
jgi:hypothetical protein